MTHFKTSEPNVSTWQQVALDAFGGEYADNMAEFHLTFGEPASVYHGLVQRIYDRSYRLEVRENTLGIDYQHTPVLDGLYRTLQSNIQAYPQIAMAGAVAAVVTEAFTADAASGNYERLSALAATYSQLTER